METQTKTSGSAKDFFINLGAIVALYTLVISLVNLLFTIINTAFPQINIYSYYSNSASISWPVATLVIFSPIFLALMWLMEREYTREPEKKNGGIHKWLTYITLFISGVAIAGDLITVLYYFIDGQELTTAFLLKILVVLVVAGALFIYYISDIRDTLTAKSRNMWRVIVGVAVLGSIILGFSVLGSPRTQRLYKYDEQKVNDLINIQNSVSMFYDTKNVLPNSLEEMSSTNYYMVLIDSETNVPYEYKKTSETTYELCAQFNKDSKDVVDDKEYSRVERNTLWTHPAGKYCFTHTVIPVKQK